MNINYSYTYTDLHINKCSYAYTNIYKHTNSHIFINTHTCVHNSQEFHPCPHMFKSNIHRSFNHYNYLAKPPKHGRLRVRTRLGQTPALTLCQGQGDPAQCGTRSVTQSRTQTPGTRSRHSLLMYVRCSSTSTWEHHLRFVHSRNRPPAQRTAVCKNTCKNTTSTWERHIRFAHSRNNPLTYVRCSLTSTWQRHLRKPFFNRHYSSPLWLTEETFLQQSPQSYMSSLVNRKSLSSTVPTVLYVLSG